MQITFSTTFIFFCKGQPKSFVFYVKLYKKLKLKKCLWNCFSFLTSLAAVSKLGEKCSKMYSVSIWCSKSTAMWYVINFL